MTDAFLTEQETLDRLDGLDVKIIQHREGYRFSIDPVLLADFSQPRRHERIVDLGCGSGVMALILARSCPTVSVLALELQDAQVERARRSVFLNALQTQVNIEQVDIRQIASSRPHRVTNSFILIKPWRYSLPPIPG